MNGANSNTLGSSVGTIDFIPKGPNHDIPDPKMAEIAERLVFTLEAANPGNVVQSPTPPEDLTKGWLQTDPVTGYPLPNGLKRWDSVAGEWVAVQAAAPVADPRKRRFAYTTCPAGASVQNVNFEDMLTSNYKVTLTPTTYNPSTSAWSPAHNSFPAAFGFEIVNKTSTGVSIAFFGVPTGGMTWEVDIEERL